MNDVAPSLPRLKAPRGLHHVAYVTHDAAATVDFYTRVMGMAFVTAVTNSEVPSNGTPVPYLHLFFQLGDGSLIAFFEGVGLPPPAPSSHPAYDTFNHLALDVGSPDNVDLWIAHARRCGVDVIGPVRHEVIYSAYMYDPNGIRIEVTTTTDPAFTQNSETAYRYLDEWQRAKEEAQRPGGDPQALVNWVAAHNGEYRRH